MDNMAARGVVPVLVGGTHYYVQAVLWSAFLVRQPPADTDAESDRISDDDDDDDDEDEDDGGAVRTEDETPAAAYARLQQVDPAMAAKLHPRDVRRVLRSLQVRRVPSPLPAASF
jgi:tRNA dimethylallyltransferase